MKGRKVHPDQLFRNKAFVFWSVVLAFVLGAVPAQAVAQGRGTALRGLVVDTTTMQPVTDAFIYLPGVRAAAHTDQAGEFMLEDVRPGTHTLLIRRRGYLPRQFRFAMG